MSKFFQEEYFTKYQTFHQIKIILTVKNLFKKLKVSHNEKQTDDEAKREKAEDMRKKSLETFMEIKARKKMEDNQICPPSKKQRSSGSETIQYLREKAEADCEFRLEERNLQREELRVRQKKSSKIKCFKISFSKISKFWGLVVQLLQKRKRKRIYYMI